MASDWQEAHWGDIATLEYGKGLRGYQEATGAYKVFGTNGPIGWHDEPLCPFPSVIIGRKGAYRGIHFSPAPFFVIDTAFYLKPKEAFDIKWAYYELLTHDINSMDSGSAIPSTSRESFYRLPVLVPPQKDQHALSHILGSLDDKIGLNRQMNKTLEGMAHAIFKSWFVDFDPVSAKAEGRNPGLPNEIAALFPDSFETACRDARGAGRDSDIGEIPREWDIRSLGEFITLTKGRSYKSTELQDSDTALVTLKSFERGGGYRPDGLKSYTGPYKPEQVVKPGELVIAQTDVTQRAEVIGKPAIVRSNHRYSIFVASLDVAIVRPKNTKISVSFLYCLLRTDRFQAHTYAHSTGTAVLHLSKEALPSYQAAFPPTGLITAFDEIASPMFRKINLNEQESVSLTALRDILLPKLISGELRVPDAEKFVEEAGV